MNALDEIKVQFPPRAGGNVPITLACALYDRMQALYTGAVQAEGIDLNASRFRDSVRRRAWREWTGRREPARARRPSSAGTRG